MDKGIEAEEPQDIELMVSLHKCHTMVLEPFSEPMLPTCASWESGMITGDLMEELPFSRSPYTPPWSAGVKAMTQ